MKRLLERGTLAALSQLASPSRVLRALVTGDEPACEVLTAIGVDLIGPEAATRKEIGAQDGTDERAS